MSYKPVRDRGVYRAAANPKSAIHSWALKLVNGRHSESLVKALSGLLAWHYRDKGNECIMQKLVYADNPLLGMLRDDSPTGKYIPVPLKHK